MVPAHSNNTDKSVMQLLYVSTHLVGDTHTQPTHCIRVKPVFQRRTESSPHPGDQAHVSLALETPEHVLRNNFITLCYSVYE